jgi:DegV family protein with EDD domain
MVRILTDTTSCLSPGVGGNYGITVVPQLVDFSGTRYREWLDLTPDAFLEKLAHASDMPASTPNTVDEFANMLQPLVESGESVICIGPSRKVSKTLEVVEQAAARFPGADIRLIDTRVIAGPNATLAILAAKWAANGQNADEIEKRLRAMVPHARVYVLVSTLDYLARGGRIGGASALVGNLLQLKPILTLKNGVVEQHEVARTFRHALVRLEEIAIALARPEWDLHLNVMHAGALEQCQTLAQDLAWKLSLTKVPIYDLPPTVTCHTGPGSLAVSFFLNEE